MVSRWSDERKKRLAEMWLGGSTSTEISAEFGDVSRNAVMGMVDRLGLMKSSSRAVRVVATGCCAPGWQRDDEVAGAAAAVLGEVAAPAVERETPPQMAAAEEVPDHVVESPVEPEPSPVPVEPAPIDPTPIEPTPIEPAPIEPAPIEPAPINPEPATAAATEAVDPAPVDPVLADDVPWEVAQDEDEPDDIDDATAEFIRAEIEYERGAAALASEPAVIEEASPVELAVPIEPDPPTPAVIQEKRVKPRPAKAEAKVAAAVPAAPADRMAALRAAVARSAAQRSRMPPSPKQMSAPPEVTISSGVMVGISTSSESLPDWQYAFSTLERLTGVAYDDRVPGHVPALVAIATVLSKGDPRRILSPHVPEQSVLRVMRRFAERGAVVAGKPPERWMVDVDDVAFYREMVETGAV